MDVAIAREFPRSVLLVDVDADGDLDLSIANQGPDDVAVFDDVATLLDGNDPTDRVQFNSGMAPAEIPEGSTVRIRFSVMDDALSKGYLFGLDNVVVEVTPTLPGDVDGDGPVQFSDFFNLSKQFWPVASIGTEIPLRY